MDYFYQQPQPKKRKAFTYVGIVVITAVLSSLTTIAVAPKVLKNVAYQSQSSQLLPSNSSAIKLTTNQIFDGDSVKM